MKGPHPELVKMVAEQIESRGVHDERVLEAMRSVPRWEFVPQEMRGSATEDRPLPIGNGQTISQPYIVALMTELLRLQGGENVLEVGTGSGYQAAILSRLASQVNTVEFIPSLAIDAQERLTRLGYPNVHVHQGDGSVGLVDFSPYDGILVTAACPSAPPALLDQLAEGGRLVMPVGGRWRQELQCWQKQGTTFESEDILPVAFVPLRGTQGWKESEW
jgi:protein-L-isoaspartate(D-aspartate) O-methyltransferase